MPKSEKERFSNLLGVYVSQKDQIMVEKRITSHILIISLLQCLLSFIAIEQTFFNISGEHPLKNWKILLENGSSYKNSKNIALIKYPETTPKSSMKVKTNNFYVKISICYVRYF